jgi:hypothetical protein
MGGIVGPSGWLVGTRIQIGRPCRPFIPKYRQALGPQVTHELLQAQVEVASAICRDVGATRAERGEVLRAAVGCPVKATLEGVPG